MNVEWDLRKAAANIKKRGVAFEEAAAVFLDPLSLTIPDPDHSFEEDRFITMGQSTTGRLLVVVHTYQRARSRATERRAYESGE